MNKKPYIHKRITAYIIDIFIISIVSSILSLPFGKTEEYNQKINELYDKTQNIVLTDNEYKEMLNDLNYDLTKINISQTIVISIVSLVYFVGFNYYKKGQTLGKRLMKLRIVSNDEMDISINNYLIRTLVGGITLSNITTVILILTMSKESYLIYESKFSTVFSIIYIACFSFAMIRNDGRGLHDLLAGTIVINDNNKIEKNEEVK